MSGALTLAAAVVLAGVPLETQMHVGGSAVTLRSCGVRDTLWIEHYVAALYVPPQATAEAVQDAEQPKAVRIRILDRRWLPSALPRKWSAALQAGLPEAPLRHVHGAYAALADGDDVVISYTPRRGTEMRVNDRLVARAAGHGVIDALLGTWAGREAVAAKLTRVASRHPCSPGRAT